MKDQFPVPVSEYAARVERTQTLLAEQGLEGIVIFGAYERKGLEGIVIFGAHERKGHIAYLTNHRLARPAAHDHAEPDLAAFVLPARGAGVLVAPAGYDKGAVTSVESVRVGGDLVSDTVKAIEGYRQGGSRWGTAGLDVPLPAHRVQLMAEALSWVKWVSADEILTGQRQIKSAAEIAALAQSASVGQAGIEAGLAAAVSGVGQEQVELAVRRGCLEAGAEAEVLCHVLVAAGACVLPCEQRARSQGPLAEGDFVYLRAWGWAQGYGFDASQVKVIDPSSAQQQDYLQHLAQATEWMVGNIEPDRRITFYYTESRGRTIYPGVHGIGLELAEEPWLDVQDAFVPKPGMVLRVAPVVACKTFGRMSISRTMVIEERGLQALGGRSSGGDV